MERRREVESIVADYRSRLAAIRLEGPGLEPASRSRLGWPRFHSNSKRRSAFLALAAAAAGALALRWLNPPPPAHQSFSIAAEQTAGLTLKDGLLLSIDSSRGVLYALDASNALLKRVEPFPEASASSLSWGGFCLWSLDRDGGRALRHRLETGYPVQQAFQLPGLKPTAVASDGWQLWVADAASHSLRQYAVGESLSPIESYPLPAAAVAAMQVLGEQVWIFDAGAGTVSRYTVEPGGGLALRDSAVLAGKLASGAEVSGLAVDERYLWLITRRPAALERFSRAALGLP